jgi:hypothetical protein
VDPSCYKEYLFRKTESMSEIYCFFYSPHLSSLPTQRGAGALQLPFGRQKLIVSPMTRYPSWQENVRFLSPVIATPFDTVTVGHSNATDEAVLGRGWNRLSLRRLTGTYCKISTPLSVLLTRSGRRTYKHVTFFATEFGYRSNHGTRDK